MAGLSFKKKRAQQPVGHPAEVSVRVFGTGGASVGGTPVVAAPGEEIQQAVLNHLQRLAISVGAPIRATIHDDRAGCVVPLEVFADGSSRVAGAAVRVGGPEPRPAAATQGAAQAPAGRFGPAPVMDTPSKDAGPGEERRVTAPAAEAGPGDEPRVTAPAVDAGPGDERRVTASAADVGPGGEPPVTASAADAPPAARVPAAHTSSTDQSAETPHAAHTPARGFDAVAEEVLGDGPLTETAEGAELLTEPMRRIAEAVRAGRVDEAGELADRALAEASAVLGPRHAEVLHVCELSAYIAYLAGDPVRAFELSLGLARLRHQAHDGEAAYADAQSAATAWRAVRDPEEGLRLGRDLIDLWTELTAEPGPAADDPRPLESARARMVRLTDRAARAARP
ncbi:tetratricopeptide repeat protein [Streptomyces sp. NPDC013455]|uniref:tetratricopeptide repeat protein n=1 Tax=Streptomyces sp. NPDC013455 TaxID=3155605 RepID=UPI0033DEB7CC